MLRALVIAAITWPLLLGASLGAALNPPPPAWASVVYLAASRICHQRTERSFHTAGVKWPVCARCSGLYLAAPVGAIAGALRRRSRRSETDSTLRWTVVAALPTAVTLAIEWLGLSPLSNPIRAVAALPLGAMIAFLLVRTVTR